MELILGAFTLGDVGHYSDDSGGMAVLDDGAFVDLHPKFAAFPGYYFQLIG